MLLGTHLYGFLLCSDLACWPVPHIFVLALYLSVFICSIKISRPASNITTGGVLPPSYSSTKMALLILFQKKSLTTTTNSHGYISTSNIKGYRCFLLQKPYEQWACYYTSETICNVVFILSNTHCQLERSFLSSTDTAIANAMSNWTYPIRIALSF